RYINTTCQVLHHLTLTTRLQQVTTLQRRGFANRLRWETDTEHAEKIESLGKDPLAVFSYCHKHARELKTRDWLAALTFFIPADDAAG
ncbi:unnamed protein product, partial [Amoebophrya sp. A25]